MADLSTSLVIRGQAVQALYSAYRAGGLLVNRRYQRKLVWSVDEKRWFVDSLMRELPVPLILVAERPGEGGARLEIIDGLQRLDAVFSFMENRFSYETRYFDLDTLAETKQAADERVLAQRVERLARDTCTRFAGYNLPISVYRAEKDEAVDDVFRRINSGGRLLSRQEIRQAGSLENFAELVREVSASVRGDYSVTDLVDLRQMPAISITSDPDSPGVFVDDVFWVRHRILTRDQVRASRDEEIIADMLASMLLDPAPAYDSRVLDEFYGLDTGSEGRRDRLEAAIQRDSPDSIKSRFDQVLTAFESVFGVDGGQFSSLMFQEPKQRVPRYFEAVFLGFDRVLTHERRVIVDGPAARAAFAGAGNKYIDIPSGGGTWRADSKRQNADVVAGLLRPHTEAVEASHPALERNALLVENLLRASLAESALVDFKQGFSVLSSPPVLSDANVAEILKTLTAMANHGRAATAFVLVGIADSQADATRIAQLGGDAAVSVHGKLLTGLGLDISQVRSLDDLLLWFTSKVRSSVFDSRLAGQVLRDMRAVEYEGRKLVVLRVTALSEPVPFAGAFYERLGSQTVEVRPTDLVRIFARFS